MLYNFLEPQDFRFPVEIDFWKLLNSGINDTESVQKGMDAMEIELSRERELSETYRKRSLAMMRELHAKEMQIQKMKIVSRSGMFLFVC